MGILRYAVLCKVFYLSFLCWFFHEEVRWLVASCINNNLFKYYSWVFRVNGKGVPFVFACRKGYGTFNYSACYGRVVDAVDVPGFLVEVVVEVYGLLFAITSYSIPPLFL